MTAAIFTAMDKEYRAVSEILGGPRGTIGDNSFTLVRSGIGKVNAASTCTALILGERPDCIISSGCAGGLHPSVHLTDIVVGRQCCYHDVWCGEPNEPGQVQGLPARFDADARLYDLAMSLAGPQSLHGGLICSGDRFCTSADDIATVQAAFPQALAVDMESCALAQVCHLYGVPFLSFRVISDSVADSDRARSYEDFWGTVSDTSFSMLLRLINSLPTHF